MSNSIDKQQVYEYLDKRIELTQSLEAHDEILKFKRLVVRGTFDSPTERLREALEQIITETKSRKFDFLIIQRVHKIANEALNTVPSTQQEQTLQLNVGDKILICVLNDEPIEAEFDKTTHDGKVIHCKFANGRRGWVGSHWVKKLVDNTVPSGEDRLTEAFNEAKKALQNDMDAQYYQGFVRCLKFFGDPFKGDVTNDCDNEKSEGGNEG